MRQEDAYQRAGHTARTLVRSADLRVVALVMKAGARIAEHQAPQSASIQTVSGHLRLHLPDRTVDLPAGQIPALAPGLRHDLEATADTMFVLTLGFSQS
ncbi:MAG: hypothetical protein H6714_00475 [Myxococcales bacterium]|nr:hypothetical protein [Myxococcales bacterium]